MKLIIRKWHRREDLSIDYRKEPILIEKEGTISECRAWWQQERDNNEVNKYVIEISDFSE